MVRGCNVSFAISFLTFFFLFHLFGLALLLQAFLSFLDFDRNHFNEIADPVLGDRFVGGCELGISVCDDEILRDWLVELELDLQELVILDSVSGFFIEQRILLSLDLL
jgi:hypothetical protein